MENETRIGEATAQPQAEVSGPSQSAGDPYIDEQETDRKRSYQFVHENLFGVLSSISGDRLTIEPLVEIQAKQGSYILIKRRKATGEKVDVALATIIDIAEGRIIVGIEHLYDDDLRPKISDLAFTTIQ